MKRGIRVKEGEDLSEAKKEEVIELLARDKPITKKEACSMLNISYNTIRLGKILEEHKELLDFRSRRRKELRTTPISDSEKAEMITTYLETGNLSEIADLTFRSTEVIKRVLDTYNIPLRNSEYNYFNPPLLAEKSIANDYNKDDLVYSARYTQPAKISKKLTEEAYRIWLTADEQYAIQPYWELGDLRKVQSKFNIQIKDRKYWSGDKEIQYAIDAARKNAKKRKKD